MGSRQTLPAGSLKVRLFSKHRTFPAGFFLDFPKSGQFRAGNDRIAAIRSQALREMTGLRQSGAKHFGKRQDCGNPEPNSSGSDRIAAIRSQTLRETTGLQQSGAKLFGKRQDCGNPEPNTSGSDRIAAIRAFPGQDEPGFPKSAHSPNTACPSPFPNETTRGPGLQESGAAPCTLPPSLRRSAHAGGRGEALPKPQALPAEGGRGTSEAERWRGKSRLPRTTW